MVIIMKSYYIDTDIAYIESCYFPNKAGMFPNFDIIESYLNIHSMNKLVPTATESEIISAFIDLGFSHSQIYNYYKEVLGYRNCLFPLSVKYPNLTIISNRLRQMWINHDIVNRVKFERLISTITDMSDISPMYNKHIKTSADDVTTPNLTDTTTNQNTKQNRTTLTDTYNSTDTHGGQDTKVTTGSDNTSSSTINGVTSFDKNDFVNNDKSSSTDNTSSSENETKSFGETLVHSGSDTHATNGSITDNGTITSRKQGTSTFEHDGDRWESELSLAQAQARESALKSLLDAYFASVSHDICLYTLEEIW